MKKIMTFKEKTEKDKLVYSIDANNKKDGILLNLACIILAAVIFLPIYFGLLHSLTDWELVFLTQNMLIFIVASISYLILHELVHGFFYKILTKEKLTFGISWTCAYCGVKDVYVHKKYAVVAVLAPFVFFNLIFIPLFIVSYLNWDVSLSILFLVLLSLHNGGCSGDLFVSYKLFTLKGEIYTLDTGPRQEFYCREE